MRLWHHLRRWYHLHDSKKRSSPASIATSRPDLMHSLYDPGILRKASQAALPTRHMLMMKEQVSIAEQHRAHMAVGKLCT